MTQLWTETPRAKRLLASIAAHPPRYEAIPSYERWTREDRRPIGYRVECLRALWNEFGTPFLDHGDATGDYGPFEEFAFGQPSVFDAVDQALTQEKAA